jgi:hypothetical protein
MKYKYCNEIALSGGYQDIANIIRTADMQINFKKDLRFAAIK